MIVLVNVALTLLFFLLFYVIITMFIGKKNIPKRLPKMKNEWIQLAKYFKASTNFETKDLSSFKRKLTPIILGEVDGFVIEMGLDKNDFITPNVIYCKIELNIPQGLKFAISPLEKVSLKRKSRIGDPVFDSRIAIITNDLDSVKKILIPEIKHNILEVLKYESKASINLTFKEEQKIHQEVLLDEDIKSTLSFSENEILLENESERFLFIEKIKLLISIAQKIEAMDKN